MKAFYKTILKEFKTEINVIEAIESNNTMIYFYFTYILVHHNPAYLNVKSLAGLSSADNILTDTLTIFKRQLKLKKVNLEIDGISIFIRHKVKIDLCEYLNNLYSLLCQLSPVNPHYEESKKFEKTLFDGSGFQKLYELKDSVYNFLRKFGCTSKEDQEDIFQESLLVFWEKLRTQEIEVYFTEKSSLLKNCRVFNRLFYQNSQIATFITGIARNLFLNRTRTNDFNLRVNSEEWMFDQDDFSVTVSENDDPQKLMFLYYRAVIEERKIRSVVSLLQSDCGFEYKEIQHLLGINNARIHSSRLKGNFYRWYNQNLNNFFKVFDSAGNYFYERTLKSEKLNQKIQTIDQFIRKTIFDVELEIFIEEFRSQQEFRQYCKIFNQIFYLITAGKPSNLSGLEEEKELRKKMKAFKEEVFHLHKIQAVLYSLFYGTDEPENIIQTLIQSLQSERPVFPDRKHNKNSTSHDNDGIDSADNTTEISDAVYSTNRVLFKNLSNQHVFKNLAYSNETV